MEQPCLEDELEMLLGAPYGMATFGAEHNKMHKMKATHHGDVVTFGAESSSSSYSTLQGLCAGIASGAALCSFGVPVAPLVAISVVGAALFTWLASSS